MKVILEFNFDIQLVWVTLLKKGETAMEYR